MTTKVLFIFLLGFISFDSFSINDTTKNKLSMEMGVSGSWWKYNRGLGEGWDRSDFVPYYNTDLSYHRVINSHELGIRLSYELMEETLIEEYNDVPDERVRVKVSDYFIKFYSMGIDGVKTVFNSPNYHLAAGLGLGTFGINTSYPGVNKFGAKFYWNGFVKQQFLIKKNCYFSIKLVYEKKHIFVPDGLEEEHHEFIQAGARIGINKYF